MWGEKWTKKKYGIIIMETLQSSFTVLNTSIFAALRLSSSECPSKSGNSIRSQKLFPPAFFYFRHLTSTTNATSFTWCFIMLSFLLRSPLAVTYPAILLATCLVCVTLVKWFPVRRLMVMVLLWYWNIFKVVIFLSLFSQNNSIWRWLFYFMKIFLRKKFTAMLDLFATIEFICEIMRWDSVFYRRVFEFRGGAGVKSNSILSQIFHKVVRRPWHPL